MRIKRIRLRHADIGFRFKFSQASNTRDRSGGLLFEVHTDSGITGFGEALPRAYVSGETVEGVAKTLAGIPTEAFRTDFRSPADIDAWLLELARGITDAGNHPACLCCGLELALLDAFAKGEKAFVLDLLGGERVDAVHYSGIIGGGMLEAGSQIVPLLGQFGFRQIKLKVGTDPEADARALDRLEDLCGPGTTLRVDANGAWNLQTARQRIVALAERGVRDIEQPMPLEDREGLITLARELPENVRIWVDDGLITLDDARWFAQRGAALGFNLKVSKNGGLFNCLRMIDIARKHGIPCQLGAQVGETSLITAAGRILAMICGEFIFHEGSMGRFLLNRDITDHPLGFGFRGRADRSEISREPGLGIRVLPELVSFYPVLWETSI